MGLATPLCLCSFMMWVSILWCAALRDFSTYVFVGVYTCVRERVSLYGFLYLQCLQYISTHLCIFTHMYMLLHQKCIETHTYSLSLPVPLSQTHSCSVEACDLRWMAVTGFYRQVCKSAQLYIRRKLTPSNNLKNHRLPRGSDSV